MFVSPCPKATASPVYFSRLLRASPVPPLQTGGQEGTERLCCRLVYRSAPPLYYLGLGLCSCQPPDQRGTPACSSSVTCFKNLLKYRYLSLVVSFTTVPVLLIRTEKCVSGGWGVGGRGGALQNFL